MCDYVLCFLSMLKLFYTILKKTVYICPVFDLCTRQDVTCFAHRYKCRTEVLISP